MIPVVLIHKGYQDYLGYSILQACQKNDVFLLGDTNPNITHHNFNLVDLQELVSNLDDFSQHYTHLNTTPYEYELFCYQRWFILKNFMEANNLDIIFYIDSDVLLWPDVTQEWQKFNQYDMTLLHRSAATSSFVTYRGLTNFCNMLIDIYSKKEEYHFNKIASHFGVRQRFGLPGGVCDMTLLEHFHYHAEFGGGPGRVGEMMTIINDTTYDHNINAQDQGFEFENGMKKLKLISGEAFVYNETLNKDIKFNSVHFQGGAKNILRSVYERCLEK
jgi:hypothetical protein